MLGADSSPEVENPRPCRIQKRLWLLTQSTLDSKTKTIGQQNIFAATEAMIDELEMGFFSDGPSGDWLENDGAQSPHDVYDGWTSTQSCPQQLSEGGLGGNLEMLEREMSRWGEVDYEWTPFVNHVYTNGLPHSQLGEIWQVDQDRGREDSMSTL